MMTIALQLTVGCAFADQAEERQRYPLNLGTMDLQKRGIDQAKQENLPYQEILKKEALENQRLKAITQGLNPKTSEVAASKTISSALPQNIIADLNLKKQMEAPKQFSLGPYGLGGAAALIGTPTSQTRSFLENASSVVSSASRNSLNYLASKFETFSKLRNYIDNRLIQYHVLKEFRADLANNLFERAAVDELLRLKNDKGFLNSIAIIDNQTENPVMKVSFYKAGMFSGTVEMAMSKEFNKSFGAYFEEIPVGSLNPTQAVRKLNLQATSPFIEQQRRAYALYRYGID